MAAKLLQGDGTIGIRVRAADGDVVWLRSVLEGYDGLAALHGDGSGVLTILTTVEQAGEVARLLAELELEAPLQVLGARPDAGG